MGINVHGARLLCYARHLGADFEQAATLGRQKLSLSKEQMASTVKSFGYGADDTGLDAIMSGANGYADAFLIHLGARNVHAFDYSAFEGATHCVDLNEPIPEAFKGAYTAVLDGGTLEHVFNYPAAIRSCMEMLRVGGHFVAITPANNFLGHGFYQFSPELFYGVFSAQNGFELKRLIAFNDRPNKWWRSARPHARWYAVANPAEVGERVTLSNSHPVSLMVIAQKIAQKPIFKFSPQQSDYLTKWAGRATTQAVGDLPRPAWMRAAKSVIPAPIRRAVRKAVQRPGKPLATRFERRFFRPFDPTADRQRH